MRMVQPGAEAVEVHGMRAVASKGVLPGHAPIGGSVCMDMCMADVTGLNVKEGDEVIVFGNDRSINDLAREMETIPYEILTGISKRVKRMYFQE